MSFGATITLTSNSVAKVLNRINQDSYGSEYLLKTTTESWRLKIRHTAEAPQPNGTRLDRHNVELTHTIFSTTTAPDVVRVFYSVYRIPYNDDLTAAGYVEDAFTSYMDNATVQADLLNWLN
jgi:hypothetical protein